MPSTIRALMLSCLAISAVPSTRSLMAQEPPQICGRVLSLTCGGNGAGQLLIERAGDRAVRDVTIPAGLVPGLMIQLGQPYGRRAVCVTSAAADSVRSAMDRNRPLTLFGPEVLREVVRMALDPEVVEAGQIAIAGAPSSGPARDDVFSTCDPLVKRPVVLRDVKPAYTASAMRARINGGVVLLGVVNPFGYVEDIRTIRSLESSLDDAAAKAFAQWRFQPATRDGVTVAVPVTVEMTFTIRR